MGNTASVLINSSPATQEKIASRFKQACEWQESKKDGETSEIINYLQKQLNKLNEDDDIKNIKSDEIRGPTSTKSVSNHIKTTEGTSSSCKNSTSSSKVRNSEIEDAKEDHITNRYKETFLDSVYVKKWLSKQEADVLYNHFVELG